MSIDTLSLCYRNECRPIDVIKGGDLLESERSAIVRLAMSILIENWQESGEPLRSPKDSVDYLTLKLTQEKTGAICGNLFGFPTPSNRL